MKARVRQIDGEFWFAAAYAAELLGTVRKTVEAMAVRELVRAMPDGQSFLIAEADVTRLRRDPNLLSEVKKSAKMPGFPRRSEPMPSGTIYKDDPFNPRAKPSKRIGNPLADGGNS